MDWGASGIVNDFRFEFVDFNLETSKGFTDLITGGSITENYDSDYRYCATFNFDGGQLPLDSLLRVWHTAELNGEIAQNELGTFMFQSQNLNHAKGRYTGTAQYQSTMYGLGTDLRGTDRAVSARNALTYFSDTVRYAHGTPLVDASLPSTTMKAHVWEYGTSVLKECNAIADVVYGIIQADKHGRICLNPYIAPRSRMKTWTLTASNYMDGVGVMFGDIVNRAHVSYQYQTSGGATKTLYSTAFVDTSHPYAVAKIGRNATVAESLDSLSANTQAAADKAAASLLTRSVNTSRKFQIQMPFMPIETGSAGTFNFNGESIFAVVSQKQINLDFEMLMTLTLEEL